MNSGIRFPWGFHRMCGAGIGEDVRNDLIKIVFELYYLCGFS